jgi:hypothetical protein
MLKQEEKMTRKNKQPTSVSPHVALLKQIRVPIWSKVLGSLRGNLRARQERKTAKTRVVFMVTITDIWVYTNGREGQEKTWYTLRQFADGHRTMEFGYTVVACAGKEKSSQTRNKYVMPWLEGLISNERIGEIALASNNVES